MNKQKNDALVGELIWRTLIPQFTTELSLSTTAIIDGIIVGRFYGKRGLAAVGLGSPILLVFIIIAGVISTGNSVLCSSLFGKSSQEKAVKVFSLSALWSVFFSVVLTVLCITFAEPIAILFSGKHGMELVPEVADYIRGFSLGVFFILFRQLMAPMVNMEGGAKYIYLSSFAILTSDFVADYVSSAFLDGGTFGLGAASAVSYVFGFGALLLFYIKEKSALKLKLSSCFSLKGSLDILREGFPTALKRFCDLVTPVITNRYILAIASVNAMAALTVQNSATKFAMCLVLSLSTMVLLLTKMFYSESDRQEMELACTKMFRHVLFWSISVSVLFFIFANPLAGFFVKGEPDVVITAAYAIRWFVAGIPALALNQCAAFYMQATGRLKISNSILVADRLVTTVLLVYLLGWLFGEKGIFIAYGASEIVLTVILYVIICIKNKKIVTSVKDMLFLPEAYGVPDDNCLFALFHTVEEATGISKEVHEFCLKKGIDKHRSYYAALCTEELVINVISHGITSNKQNVSVRLFIDQENGLTIRLRDNGKPFNIKERENIIASETDNPAKNIGIRIVFGLAKSVSYNAAYGINNTVITF